MEEKLPHYTTLQKFSARSNVVAIVEQMIRTIGRAAARGVKGPQVAVDATGLETTSRSYGTPLAYRELHQGAQTHHRFGSERPQ